MKVALIYRGKDRNELSIETLFECLMPYLNKNADVTQYYLPHGHMNRFKNIITNLLYTRKVKADVYHITGEVYIAGCVTPAKRTIITMHDYVNLEVYHGLKKFISWLFWDYIPLKRCKYVVCISEKVCKETIQRFPFTANKVIYIPNSISSWYQYEPYELINDAPTVLVVGTRDNKNLETIINAVEGLNCGLHIIGKLSEKQSLLLVEKGIKYTSEYGISEKDMHEAYVKCDMLCFPSLYEGFGRPIIEAQAIGRPVITSDLEPMKSVAGDAAILVDPLDAMSIRKAITNIVNDSNLRECLISRGLDNVKRYMPQDVAGEYSNLYQEINKKYDSK